MTNDPAVEAAQTISLTPPYHTPTSKVADIIRQAYAEQMKQILGAMLNANITLHTLSDHASVPGSLARQARKDAKALSEAIALLRGEQP